MKSYGIEMEGPFTHQNLASLPSWAAADEGREIYITANKKKYYGDDAGWVESQVDKIWTYQDTAPTGWSVIAGTADTLLATKGGLDAYNVAGGTHAGTWTQPNHSHGINNHTHTTVNHTHTTGSHTLTISEMPSHTHVLARVFVETGIHAFHSGVGLRASDTEVTQATGGGGTHNHGVTQNAGSAPTSSSGPGSTNAAATAATYRPGANVGIIIERS